MQFKQLAALAMLGGFFRRRKVALGQRNAALLGDCADRFGKADVLDFLHEGEYVAGLTAAKAVIKLASGVDAEGRRLFFVEGAQAAEVLRPGFAKTDVVANNFDDVGLVFHAPGEVGVHLCGVRLQGTRRGES